MSASSTVCDSRRPLVTVFTGPTSYAEIEPIQALVQRSLDALGLPDDYVRYGDRVVLKPNWVKEHDERFPGPGQWEHVVTHPAVVEAVINWVAIRLNGSGSIVICDAPQTDSSFASLNAYCGLDKMVARCRRTYPGTRIDLVDLRPEEWHCVDGVIVARRKLPGDPAGSTRVDLKDASEFVGFDGCGRLYGASYDIAETNARHTGGRHEYLLCRTPMDADLLINLPKLKTHKKVGITCSLKNLVGINADKNWLPHHTEGTPDQGGDQFPTSSVKSRLEHSWMGVAKRWLHSRPAFSRLFVPVKKVGRLYFGDTQTVVRSGNWHGNDTCWRMVLDLNKALFFFDGSGARRRQPLRYLTIVDGIVAGEGNGPMAPDRKECGVVLAGTDPVAVDAVAATLMGFDWRRMRLLARAFTMGALSFSYWAPADIVVRSDRPEWSGGVDEMTEVFDFRPHFGWVGAIERVALQD